ncbi:Phosphatidylserine decarboxylase [Rubrobacter radiotolerans]|uniref:Phosphatidylserine decarboxylase n=1 Tax=Rubrobacter radiotolerans TaxID=42256 RepID=A0A023X089_RUBRA|nr:phosphatidylserine decarboxylase [Rubrobacter radiotolerans]AHY45435.1 Phosphatidylserine decarboxylase [Rubrobacter radiotolerans]MDX5892846.1 phosphatidylserine decarboxylase [Rubrobacter radiotolerans]SMC02615.1 phosphatidylserine decarboxylase [Rubrobacter radiotolerans DSM 5868]
MMTRRTWRVARRYALPPLAAGGGALLLGRRRAGLALAGISALALAFFRDPERETARGVRSVYAPADGLVREVRTVRDETLGQAERISTFLNLHNVHVNRAPFGGRIRKLERIEGGYAPALFGSSEENFRVRIEVEGERGPYVVVQKAGAIARRITPYVSPGDGVRAGERIGVIHFGSRTDVLFPAGSVRVLAEEGMRVRAGMTEIARYVGEGERP